MEYVKILGGYAPAPDSEKIASVIRQAQELSVKNTTRQVFERCYSCLDLTSLESTDSVGTVTEFTRKVVGQSNAFPGVAAVAAICVYPSFVETVGVELGDSNIRVACVAGGFPSSQTFLEVKMLEAAMAVENGADEVDVVLNVGEVLSGQYDAAGSELEILRGEVGDDVTLKVIIESGLLPDAGAIRDASLVAMEAGADFIKTSTGKTRTGATPEAAVVMCSTILDYYNKTGRKVGFKVAGGVRSAQQAVMYYSIVESVLGQQWLTPSLFRIGASSAANALLGAMTGDEVKYY